jgi:hypothetical protein
MDAGFDRTEHALRDQRVEMRDLRVELKGDIDGLRAVMVRFAIAIMVCMAGVIATLIGALVTGSISG